jgi:di/tricarboxylate transporter
MAKGAVTTIFASLATINGIATTLPAATLTISSFSITASSSASTAAAGHGGHSQSDQINIGVGLSMGLLAVIITVLEIWLNRTRPE